MYAHHASSRAKEIVLMVTEVTAGTQQNNMTGIDGETLHHLIHKCCDVFLSCFQSVGNTFVSVIHSFCT